MVTFSILIEFVLMLCAFATLIIVIIDCKNGNKK